MRESSAHAFEFAIQGRRFHATLVALWIAVVLAPLMFGNDSAKLLRLNQHAVTQRLVSLGFDEQQSRAAVEKLPAEQVIRLASSFGDPSGGIWMLTVCCFAALATFGWFFFRVL